MAKWFAVIGALAFALAALLSSPAHAQAVLRDDVVAAGPAVTLGDFFEGAGEVSGRAVAPAPRAGQTTTFSARFVAAAAAAAGLEWQAPGGLSEISVRGVHASARDAGAAAAIRRGDAVTLVYVAPGLQLTARGRALNDAAVGQPVRVVNLQSNVTVEAVATGPGAVSANINP
jgi:flagellar basal body P-ring formation protein FlgA